MGFHSLIIAVLCLPEEVCGVELGPVEKSYSGLSVWKIVCSLVDGFEDGIGQLLSFLF